PLDVDDSELDRINATLGVPTMTRPPREQPAAVPLAAPLAAIQEKLTIEVPEYLMTAVRRAALDQRSSIRHVVMQALRQDGFEIAESDMVPDGRRSRSKP
ncbi:MAG: hypothetical protein AB7E80_17225, partial [Hyphomicrobiaceae bacterium]